MFEIVVKRAGLEGCLTYSNLHFECEATISDPQITYVSLKIAEYFWTLFSFFEGENDAGEKPVDPIRVYSDKELTKEVEKAAAMLTPEQDWSVRISAMQKIEGLVAGGEIRIPTSRFAPQWSSF